MEPEHRALLREHRLELSGQLLVSDSIVPFLYQENILTQTQVEDIESLATNRQKTLKLLDILPNCGPRAFHAFLQSLGDFCWIRDQLLLELRTRAGSESTGERRHESPQTCLGFISSRTSVCVLSVPVYPVHRSVSFQVEYLKSLFDLLENLKRTRWFNSKQLYLHKLCYSTELDPQKREKK